MSEINEQPRKRFLVLDTSTAAQVVAVMEGTTVLAAESSNADRNHSVGLLDSITRMLEAASVSRCELDGIAVGVGPGSYTGIRIAVTTAKTLAWTLKLPVAGFSSLAALALSGYNAAQAEQPSDHSSTMNPQGESDLSSTSPSTLDTSEQSGVAYTRTINEQSAPHDAPATNDMEHSASPAHVSWIVPLMDARRGQVYTGLFADTGEGAPSSLEADRIVLMEDWVDHLIERYESLSQSERPVFIYIVGDTALHEERAMKLVELARDRVQIVACSIEAEFAGWSGALALLSGQEEPAHALLPNYTQLSEAEANLLRQSQ